MTSKPKAHHIHLHKFTVLVLTINILDYLCSVSDNNTDKKEGIQTEEIGTRDRMPSPKLKL